MTITVQGPIGRPLIEPTDEDIARIETWAAEGVGIESMCRALAIDRSVFSRWRKDHPAVVSALALGREQEEMALVGNLRKLADGGNLVANIFLLKTRHTYREHGDLPGQQGNSVNITFKLPGAQKPDEYVHDISNRTSD